MAKLWFRCGACLEAYRQVETDRFRGGAILHEACGATTTYKPCFVRQDSEAEIVSVDRQPKDQPAPESPPGILSRLGGYFTRSK